MSQEFFDIVDENNILTGEIKARDLVHTTIPEKRIPKVIEKRENKETFSLSKQSTTSTRVLS